MRQLAIVVLAVSLAGCTPGAVPGSQASPSENEAPDLGVEGVVVRAKDGDSLVVVVDGLEEDVRLIGINAPESDECWGPEARTDLARLEDRTVVLGFDSEQRDQYGRLLAYVWVDGSLVNAELVANGSAIASEFGINTALTDRIAAGEDAAKDSRVGMWSPQACGDTALIDLDIVGVDANPPGPDEERLNEESVTILNPGAERVSLSGMVLRDASTVHRYTFPPDASIGPGQEIRVVTGCGSDTPTLLHWCSDGPVWDNAGDDALLTTARGTIVAHYDYGT